MRILQLVTWKPNANTESIFNRCWESHTQPINGKLEDVTEPQPGAYTYNAVL
jgi:hypothetical protein